MKKLQLEALGRPSIQKYQNSDKMPVVVVLDNVRSALNVGSIFRTSDAFAVEKIILCGITATPPHREITKTAIGATESVDWSYAPETCDVLTDLKNEGYILVGIEQTDHSISIESFDMGAKKIAVILGNEVDGINDDVIAMLDLAVDIPQFGTKHSLNVSVCGGIILWELNKLYRRAMDSKLK